MVDNDLIVKCVVRIDWYEDNLAASASCELLPRDDVRVMLCNGGENHILGTDVLIAPCSRNEINR